MQHTHTHTHAAPGMLHASVSNKFDKLISLSSELHKKRANALPLPLPLPLPPTPLLLNRLRTTLPSPCPLSSLLSTAVKCMQCCCRRCCRCRCRYLIIYWQALFNGLAAAGAAYAPIHTHTHTYILRKTATHGLKCCRQKLLRLTPRLALRLATRTDSG